MDFEDMNPDEINRIIEQAKQELIRRQNVELVENQVRQVLLTARENGVTEDRGHGEEWVQPLGAHDSYLTGDTVTFEGKTYVSLSSANTWQPPIGWRDVTDDGTPPEWVRPSSTVDAYQTGDLVTFEGKIYQSVIDSNTWSPTDYPDAWEEQ